MELRVVRREPEGTAIAEFLTSVIAEPGALVLEGEAGIGKTTLWSEAVELARTLGFHVMTARPVAAEPVPAYTSLAELLDDVDPAVRAELPSPQRTALDQALRADTGYPPADQRAVAAAFLSVVTNLASQTKVLVAVDDLQWLDSSTRLVIAFTIRRLSGPVAVLATVRTGDGVSPDSWLQLPTPDTVQRITVPPMTLGALHAVISQRLGRSLSRPMMVRVEEISRGNPFYALELVRATDDERPDADLALPESLTELVRSKVRTENAEWSEALLAVACLADPTVEILARALGAQPDAVVALLEDAENDEILDIDGEHLRFRHPLFARAVYTIAPLDRRQAMHSRLARVVEEPELRARHLALGRTSGDAETLQALDSAAEAAFIRGAPAAAAELVDMAIGLGGNTPQRRIRCAGHHFSAGEPGRARALLEATIAGLEPGALRAEAANVLGYVRLLDDSFPEAADLLEAALPEAADHPDVLVSMLVTLSFALFNAGRMDAAVQRVEEAVTRAESLGRPDLLSQALAMRVTVRFLSGRGADEAGLRRALELEAGGDAIPFTFLPRVHGALLRSCTGEFDQAHRELESLRNRCVERGQDGELMLVGFHYVLLEIWRGEFGAAAQLVGDTVQRAHQLGGDLPLSVALIGRALLSAYLGRADDARDDVEHARAASRRCGSDRLGEWPATALAFLEVSLGNYSVVPDIVAPVMAKVMADPDATEIIAASFVPDAVEALAHLGQCEAAEPLVSALERNGARLQRDWMLAVGARCRALVLAAGGDLKAAVATAEEAMVVHDRLPMPFERARTQLLLGQLQRRLRLKDATQTLYAALDTFDNLGTSLWAARARMSLRHSRPPRPITLNGSERQLAELAASGMTNRDIAAAMYLSPKTVESRLARIYTKLGIRSRAELGRHVGLARE